MSWLSDGFDAISGLFTDDNGKLSSWVKPVVGIGLGALKQSNADDTQQAYLDYLKQRETQNYQDYVNQANAYNAALAAGGSGGGSRGGGGSNRAAAQAAAKKANQSLQNTYKQILAMYAPYKKVADTLLPQMTQTYQNSLGLQNALSQFVNSPSQVAKLNGSVPAWQTNVPLPNLMGAK